MKNIILILTLSLTCFGQGGTRQVYGLAPILIGGKQNFSLSTAATGGFSASWLSYRFTPLSAKTLSKVRVYVHTTTGTLATTDFVCDVYSDVAGQANASLATSNTVASIPASGSGGWIEWTGFSLPLTGLTQYWLVIRNANATPTSNSFAPRYLTGWDAEFPGGPFLAIKTSTNSGGTWTSPAVTNPVLVYRLEYGDGTFSGFPFEDGITPSVAGANYKVRSTAQAGAVFTSPSVGLVVQGCGIMLAKVGSPTGNVQCRIISDNGSTVTTVATSDTVYLPADVDTTPRWAAFWFATAVTLTPATKYRFVLIESTQSDSTSIYYAGEYFSMANDASSQMLTPAQGTWRGTYCAATCSTRANWTDDSTVIPLVGLLLARSGEFTVGSGKGPSAYVQ